jgi:hypothetical protein
MNTKTMFMTTNIIKKELSIFGFMYLYERFKQVIYISDKYGIV